MAMLRQRHAARDAPVAVDPDAPVRDVQGTPLEHEALLLAADGSPRGLRAAAKPPAPPPVDTGRTSLTLLLTAAVGFLSAAALAEGPPTVSLLLPDPWMLVEHGFFLGGGACIGSLPTFGLLWLARGERGERTAPAGKRVALQAVTLLWCVLSLAVPFLLPASRGGLGPMSMALMLWVNLWKAADICARTNPPSVLHAPLNLFAHLTFLIEYKTSRRMMPRTKSELTFFPRTASEQKQLAALGVRTSSEHRLLSDAGTGTGGRSDEEQDEPEAPEEREWLSKLLELGRTLALFFLLASASELTPPRALVGHAAGALCVEWLSKYSHVWYIYAFLKMACDANSAIVLLLGFRPQTVFRNPLTASTSPTDFWSRRWNMLVRGLFHRTVFTPLRRRNVPAWVSALVAFIVSGAFHEYAFAPASHGAAVGSLTLFFSVQAAACSLELLVRKAASRVAALRDLDSITPDYVRVLLTSALLVPFSPLFMAPLHAHGTIDQMRSVMVRVRVA